jgi:hypothetical protein
MPQLLILCRSDELTADPGKTERTAPRQPIPLNKLSNSLQFSASQESGLKNQHAFQSFAKLNAQGEIVFQLPQNNSSVTHAILALRLGTTEIGGRCISIKNEED